MKKILGWTLSIVLLVGLAGASFMMYQMGPRNFFGMLRYDQREEGELAVGDAAPDVVLAALDGSDVRLRDRFGGKPVVLVFGSYT